MSVGRTLLTKVLEGVFLMFGLIGSSLAAAARTGDVECPRERIVRPDPSGGGTMSDGTSMEFLAIREVRELRL